MISEESKHELSGSESSGSDDLSNHTPTGNSRHDAISSSPSSSSGSLAAAAAAAAAGMNASAGLPHGIFSQAQHVLSAGVVTSNGHGSASEALHNFTMAAAANSHHAHHNAAHYAAQDNVPFFMMMGGHGGVVPGSSQPAHHSHSHSQASSANSSASAMSHGHAAATAAAQMHHEGGGHDNSRKREMRLMKNREAARECRRKKKEYIKCLENRVAVLENQNKALIEELKSLNDLYTGKQHIRKVELM